MTAIDIQICRFSYYDTIRFNFIFFDDVLPAKTVTIFLHHSSGYIKSNVISQSNFLKNFSSSNCCYWSAFLINTSSAVNKSIFNLTTERIKCPVLNVSNVNSVYVSVYRNNFFPAANSSDNISKSVNLYFIKAGISHHLIKFLNNGSFFGAQRFYFYKFGEIVCSVILILFCFFVYELCCIHLRLFFNRGGLLRINPNGPPTPRPDYLR